MAITVEDGTIKANANSYVSLSFADSYHETQNNTEWAALSDEQKEGSLLRAAQYLDYNYEWRGSVVNSLTQIMAWPRYSCVDDEGRVYTYPNSESFNNEGVPLRVQHAQCEIALTDATTEILNVARSRGGNIKRIELGPIEEEYFDSAPSSVSMPHVETLLRGLHDGALGAGDLIQTLSRA